MSEDVDVKQLLTPLRAAETVMLQRLRTLVEMESPTVDKSRVDEAQSTLAAWAVSAGATVRRHPQHGYGDSLEIVFGEEYRAQAPILLLGHMDTVWDTGTLAAMPWQVTEERISGPGVLDMKAGLVMALTAVEQLDQLNLLRRPVTLLVHGEEEVGSPVSRSLTEAVALRSSAVFVLEPAQGAAGAYKTARKGVGHYRLTVTGVAAHSGIDFELGHSAVVELARQIERLHALTDPSRGITVNPGVIGGGTLANIVAAQAWVDIDVRIAHASDLGRMDRAIHALQPIDRACTLSIRGEINRPPMERTEGTAVLFRQAQALAAQLGFELQEAATGGASDGNFTSALGIPTLDGMGAVGAGAHAPHEHLLRSFLVPRTALLAAMLLAG